MMDRMTGTTDAMTVPLADGDGPPLRADPPAHKPHISRQITTEERDLAVRLASASASASIADAIGLYMRSDRHRHMSIADLEWMLLPPLMFNQIKFAYARPQRQQSKAIDGAEAGVDANAEKLPPMAVAMITWAMVSPEVAAKLEAQKKAEQPFRLAPQEWRSGAERRIIDAIGSKDMLEKLIKRVAER